LREGDETAARGGPLRMRYLPAFSAFLTSYEIRKKNQTEDMETA
jgi:hypothetical protein